jgi:plastocyanin
MGRTTIGRASALALAVVATFALVACGGDDGNGGGTGSAGPAEGAGGATGEITISGFAFNPSTLDVQPSDTITVVNDDSTDHTFTADDGSFDEELAPGDSVEVTLEGNSGDEVGFHCEIHPSMTGTLTFG